MLARCLAKYLAALLAANALYSNVRNFLLAPSKQLLHAPSSASWRPSAWCGHGLWQPSEPISQVTPIGRAKQDGRLLLKRSVLASSVAGLHREHWRRVSRRIGLRVPRDATISTYSTSANPSAGTVRIWQDKSRGIGFQMWPAATLLCEFIASNPKTLLDLCGKDSLSECSILELGAGVGLCGLYLARLGAHVTVTDLPQVLAGLRASLRENYDLQGRVKAEPLAWGTDDVLKFCAELKPDVIVGADLIYHEHLYQSLCYTVAELCHKTGACVILAQRRRIKREKRWFKLAQKAGLTVTVLHEVVNKQPLDARIEKGASGGRHDIDGPSATMRIVDRVYKVSARLPKEEARTERRQ